MRERGGERGGYARDNAQRIMQEMLYGDRPRERESERAEMRLSASGMFAIEREVQSILVMEFALRVPESLMYVVMVKVI